MIITSKIVDVLLDTSSSEIQTIIAHSTGLAFHQMDSSNALDTQYGTVWHFGIQLSVSSM